MLHINAALLPDFDLGVRSRMSRFVAAHGFDPDRVRARDISVDADAGGTLTVRVFRLDAQGRRIKRATVGEEYWEFDELTVPLVAQLEDFGL